MQRLGTRAGTCGSRSWLQSVAVRPALTALCLLCACAGPLPNLDSPGRTIVCFGDSLTAGVGRGDGPTYPEHLARELGLEVVEAGVPGETASQALQRLEAVLAHDPWLVIVELGGNDILRRVPPETTEEALGRIVEGLLDARILPVLLEVRGPFGGRYRNMFDRLERRYRVPVIRDVLPRLLVDRRYKSDAVHLNAAGYRRLAELVARELEPLVRRRQAA